MLSDERLRELIRLRDKYPALFQHKDEVLEGLRELLAIRERAAEHHVRSAVNALADDHDGPLTYGDMAMLIVGHVLSGSGDKTIAEWIAETRLRPSRRYSEEEVRKAVEASFESYTGDTANGAAADVVWRMRRLRGEGEARVAPASTHAVRENGDCTNWCPACRDNVSHGLNPDGSQP